MSLVLNGTNQAAYVDAAVADAFPFVVTARYKANPEAGQNKTVAGLVDSAAANGAWLMNMKATRSTGQPQIITTTVNARQTTESVLTLGVTTALGGINITGITPGNPTTLTLASDPTVKFKVGDFVKLSGAGTGLSPDIEGDDIEIVGITGNTLQVEVSTSGTFSGGAITAYSSVWQRDDWNLLVAVFADSSPYRSIYIGNDIWGTDLCSNTASTPSNIATTFAAMNRFVIGAQLQATNDIYLNGEVADVAVIQGVRPSAAQVQELMSAGPEALSWGTLKGSWPLRGDQYDTAGTNHLTLLNSPSITSAGPSYGASSGGRPARLRSFGGGFVSLDGNMKG